ncbi:hypothetical protein [Pseudanabaena sp. CCNP1317]|uniref:hypothetical protein n=1 Tax=Pseudanabaena sp. CCNP1317 TaxID=3110253 RepID=UPI002B1F1457|nr:hypothetical protein [Pseudanabaena sp. CCNP1317]MEA5486611.1 hypothetical protein [Pseudanabaena sp. CCNP1317]
MSSVPRLSRVARAFPVGALLVALSGVAVGASFPGDPSVNLGVAVKPGSQTVQKAATLPDGTTWVAWFDAADGSFRVYAQLLSPTGDKAFADDGLLVSSAPQSTSLVDWDIIADADGAAVLVFTDTRDGADRDVIAQRILPDGTAQWGTNGKQISINADFEAAPRVVQDAVTGQYHISWLRSDSARGIYYQRLDASGVEQVEVGGVRIAGDGVEGPGFHTKVAHPSGGFIMVYVRDTRTFASPRHVYAQRFDSSAGASWNMGGPVIVSNASSIPIAQYPQIALASDGGAAFAWSDSREGPSRVFAQRVDASGAPQFAANGVSASTRADRIQFEPAIAFVDDTLDLMLFFNDRNGAQSIRGIGVQRFGPSGARSLGDFGVEVLPFNAENKTAPRAARASGGATMLVTVEPSFGVVNLVAVRVDAAGQFVWDNGGVRMVSDANGSKSRLLATTDASGVVRAVWEDGRNDSGDVFAQNINPDGTLGAATTPCPGDTNGDGVVNFSDLNAVLSAFGQSGAGIPGDLNGDGVVNFSDLNIVLSEFGSSCD